MRLLYLAWKHGGLDPYRLFNCLRDDYRPLERPDQEPLPPVFPTRLRSVIYAFAAIAEIEMQQATMMSAGLGGAA
jgi:hypothetical protein